MRQARDGRRVKLAKVHPDGFRLNSSSHCQKHVSICKLPNCLIASAKKTQRSGEQE